MTENKFDYRKILSKYSIVLVLIVIMREYPKVCVNLQTDVR